MNSSSISIVGKLFLEKMLCAHKHGVKQVQNIVGAANFYPAACLRNYLELMIKHYQMAGTALLHAAMSGHNVEVVTALLELDATLDVNVKTTEDETALDIAQSESYRAMHFFNAVVDEAARAKHLARIQGYIAIIQLLRDRGAKTSEELAADKPEAKAPMQTPSAVVGSISKLMGEVAASEQAKTVGEKIVNEATEVQVSVPKDQGATGEPDPNPGAASPNK